MVPRIFQVLFRYRIKFHSKEHTVEIPQKKDVIVLFLTSHRTVFFCSIRPSPLPQDFPKSCLQFSYWYASIIPLLNIWPIHKSSILSLVFYLRLNNNLPSFTPEFTFQSSSTLQTSVVSLIMNSS